MNDDVSSIAENGCNVLTSSTTLTNYNGNVRKDYIFNGGKWYPYRTQTTFNNYDLSAYNCINVSALDSYAVYRPFMYTIAFGLFICFAVLVFKLIKGFLYVR